MLILRNFKTLLGVGRYNLFMCSADLVLKRILYQSLRPHYRPLGLCCGQCSFVYVNCVVYSKDTCFTNEKTKCFRHF